MVATDACSSMSRSSVECVRVCARSIWVQENAKCRHFASIASSTATASATTLLVEHHNTQVSFSNAHSLWQHKKLDCIRCYLHLVIPVVRLTSRCCNYTAATVWLELELKLELELLMLMLMLFIDACLLG